MTDAVTNSRLIAGAHTDDLKMIELHIGNPIGEFRKFQFTYEAFESLVGHLNEMSTEFRKQKLSTENHLVVVPTLSEAEVADSSSGGEVVVVSFRAKGSLRTSSYAIPPDRAEELGAQLRSAAIRAKTTAPKKRH